MKKKHTPIIVIIILLIIGIGVFSYLNRPEENIKEGMLSITKDGEVLKELSIKEIKDLPKVEEKIKFSSSNFANEEALYTGVPVREILNSIDPQLLKNAKQIITKAEDGFISAFSADEVAASDSVIVAYAREGKGLGTKEDGGVGPLRVVIKTDPFGNRSTKYLNELEVK